MNKVLFCSHGRLCEGMVDTLKVFSLYDENHIKAIPFFVDGVNSNDLLDKWDSELKSDETALIFTDVMFGSVNQLIMSKYQHRENVYIVSGMNLMVVLELIAIEDLYEDIITNKVQNCKDSIVFTRNLKKNVSEDDE